MAETPAVALLFEDVALGDQLRSALLERGARIVHEGGLSDLSRERVLELGADVLVVNLDDDNDDALDRLCDVIEGDRPRVVFNDAQASRKLDGWDRARWARHLAVKVLSMGDVDPPRPADATPVPVFVLPAGDEQAVPDRDIRTDEPGAGMAGDPSHEQTVAASETLAAELEALLAAGNLAEDTNEFGDGLNYAAGADVRLNDSHFDDGHSAASPDTDAEAADPLPRLDAEVVSAGDAIARLESSQAFKLDDLTLVPVEATENPSAAGSGERVQAQPAIAPARSSDDWSLLEEGDIPLATNPSVAPAGPAAFGIEKVSAADYLAPDTGGADESPMVVGMSLELVSMEEAIAPRDFDSSESRPNEMVLGELAGALDRLVVLGATTESTQSVCEFLSALPAGLRLTFLHTQHLAGKPADALVEHLAGHCKLPVRLAEPGRRAQTGEVLVVPSDQRIHLLRDGSITSEPVGGSSQAPSIDSSFTMAASVFGTDAVAIVFAGRSTDAVGGCQAVHDRGGQVWVEAGTGEHVADMVSAVVAERLSHYSGTPQQLAVHLIEEYSKENRP